MVQLGWAIVSAIISYAISSAMAPKPQNATAGEFDVPTAAQGSEIPVWFGTNISKAPNVVWFGNAGVTKILSKGGK